MGLFSQVVGFNNVWLSQGVANINMFLSLCKQRLKDQFIQEWFSTVGEMSETSWYRHIKQEFGYSTYLEVLTVPKYRYSLSRFIHRNHRLPIIAGRWSNKPYQERLCEHCDMLGDEYHFILCCTEGSLPELRRKYIKKYYYLKPSMDKFIQLFSNTSKKVLQNLAMYIYKGLYEK